MLQRRVVGRRIGHIISEMAQTWQKLADLHELTEKLKSSGALLKKPVPGAE